jgi:hypothetical protein
MTDQTPTQPSGPDPLDIIGERVPSPAQMDKLLDNLFIRPVDGDDDSWQALGFTDISPSLIAPGADDQRPILEQPAFTGTVSINILPDTSQFLDEMLEAIDRAIEAERDFAITRAVANNVGVLVIQDEYTTTHIVTDRVPSSKVYVMPSAAVAIVLGIDA